MKDTLYNCWDNEENLGMIRIDESTTPDDFSIEIHWKRWYENTVNNDEPLDVDSFIDWLELEYPEIVCDKPYIHAIYAI